MEICTLSTASRTPGVGAGRTPGVGAGRTPGGRGRQDPRGSGQAGPRGSGQAGPPGVGAGRALCVYITPGPAEILGTKGYIKCPKLKRLSSLGGSLHS